MKYLIKFIITMVLATISVNASAVSLATAGTIDTKIGQDTLGNSGAATEEAWIEGIIGKDIDYTQLSGSGGSEWEVVDGGVAGDYAFDFGAGVGLEFFLVKVGNGNGTGADNSHFLYENEANLQWGFINLADFGADVSLDNIGIISHVGITDPGSSVPAPGPLAIMAIGLIGLLGMGRVKKSIS